MFFDPSEESLTIFAFPSLTDINNILVIFFTFTEKKINSSGV